MRPDVTEGKEVAAAMVRTKREEEKGSERG
jgi:hypothetical protein